MVYLLHFSIPYPRRSNGHYGHGVQHYLGWTENLKARIWHHRNGTGSRLLKHVVASGRTVVIARRWALGTRALERKLKRRHGGVVDICPICSGRRAYKKARDTSNASKAITASE